MKEMEKYISERVKLPRDDLRYAGERKIAMEEFFVIKREKEEKKRRKKLEKEEKKRRKKLEKEEKKRRDELHNLEIKLRSEGAFGSKSYTGVAKEAEPQFKHTSPFFTPVAISSNASKSLSKKFMTEKAFEEELKKQLPKLCPEWEYRKFKVSALGQEPDVGVFRGGSNTDADNVVLIGELKNDGSSFTNGNLGQILDYLFKTLIRQWPRRKIYGFLESPSSIRFLCVTVRDDVRRPLSVKDFDIHLTDEFPPDTGLPLLNGLLSQTIDTLGFSLPNILDGATPQSVIGHGVSSTVFLLSDKTVAKVSVDPSHNTAFDNEVFILHKLEELGVGSVPRCVLDTTTSDPNKHQVIVMSPFCSQPIPLHKLADVVLILQQVHSHGITHRDVRMANIRMDDTNTVHLLDWGFAGLQGQPYAGGAFSCAPIDILRCRSHPDTPLPEYKPEHDLLSLVETFAKRFSTDVEVVIRQHSLDTPEHAAKLADAWSDILQSVVFKPFADAASVCNYDVLAKLFWDVGTLGVGTGEDSSSTKHKRKHKLHATKEEEGVSTDSAVTGGGGGSSSGAAVTSAPSTKRKREVHDDKEEDPEARAAKKPSHM